MPPIKRTDAENKTILEAMLFATPEPANSRRLAEAAGGRLDGREVRRLIEEMRQEYDAQGRAFQIEEVAGGFQILTRPEYHKWVRELLRSRGEERLSASAIETLAIVAYKQPILRAEIEDIRGVGCGPLLRSLVEKGLVKIVGRKNVPGRPILYGTSKRFMLHFHLKSLKELPQIGDEPPSLPAEPEPLEAGAPESDQEPEPAGSSDSGGEPTEPAEPEANGPGPNQL